MPVDTSREAVEALIDDLRIRCDEHPPLGLRPAYDAGARYWFARTADTLAAVLDERDVAIKNRQYETEQKVKLAERIRELEAALNIERKRRKNVKIDSVIQRAERAEAEHLSADNVIRAILEALGSVPDTDPVIKSREVVAERDHLAVELAQVTQCRDEYGDEIDVVNTRWERAEVERDKLAAKLDAVTAQRFHEAYERLAPEFGYRTREASAVPWADVPEQNKRLMEATVATILADTNEGSSDRG